MKNEKLPSPRPRQNEEWPPTPRLGFPSPRPPPPSTHLHTTPSSARLPLQLNPRVPLRRAAAASAAPRASARAGIGAPTLLEREINRNPWAPAASVPEPDAVPVLFATLYELPPPAGGAALFVRIHTAACDRAASAALVKELLALVAGAGVGEQEEEAAADSSPCFLSEFWSLGDGYTATHTGCREE